MGYVRHHGILVTSWDAKLAHKAYRKARKLCPGQVSPINESAVNRYSSFAVFPDGSKEGWDESGRGDAARQELKDWMRAQAYEDGSSALRWVEVQYGDDEYETAIIDDGDRELRENGVKE